MNIWINCRIYAVMLVLGLEAKSLELALNVNRLHDGHFDAQVLLRQIDHRHTRVPSAYQPGCYDSTERR